MLFGTVPEQGQHESLTHGTTRELLSFYFMACFFSLSLFSSPTGRTYLQDQQPDLQGAVQCENAEPPCSKIIRQFQDGDGMSSHCGTTG